MNKIERIFKKSIEVFKECCLKNGAIVASDIYDPDYPKDVKWYGYVWPRDASYVCYAADLLGLHEIPRKFFRWCWEYAEDLKEKGVFLYHKFYPNGRIAGDFDIGVRIKDLKNDKLVEFFKTQTKVKLFYSHFQPDQTGSLLWAIGEHSKFEDITDFENMIEKVADGICNFWKKDCFKIPSLDLWEEKASLPSLKQVHTYSLAMCAKGLENAISLTKKPRETWRKTLKEMKVMLQKCFVGKIGYFVKTYGKKIDRTVDSSALGLVWPSAQFSVHDERIVKTVEKIVEMNCKNGGIQRYPKDRYDGKIMLGDLELNGAGAWPILNFWLSIYFSIKGEKEKALGYFNWVVERVEEKLPEQIKNGKPASIIPLAWSHAMFIIAGKFLKIF
ncbi:MAG: hypothetical protein QXP77_03340 [Candidatus Aenigmatarchaeota archaeon]